MPLRLKKLIGSVLIAVLLIIYCLLAVMFASLWLKDSHWLVHLAYFAFTGIFWVVPAMVLIKWMMRDDKRSSINQY